MSDDFTFLRLRAPGRDHRDLARQLRQVTLPAWAAQDAACWGIWQGLFGLASNELIVMLAGSGAASLGADPGTPADALVVDRLDLRSTVRPHSTEPLTRDGLYVFRFFEVPAGSRDELVALSQQAWQTFEATDRYASRPEGLFRPRDDQGASRMLLVTWYDGFESWSASRAPAPQATDNFRRRHELTNGTVAYATRLLRD